MRRLFALCALIAAPVLAADTWPLERTDVFASPVDLSFLNATERPAGRRGFLGVRGDRLVFADGTVARFWGTSLTAAALFGTERANVARHARRLSMLGFNLVRFHHHDSEWVEPNVFGPREAPDTRQLDPQMLERIDWWIKCLKDEGIYVWLDLHVGRRLKPGDGIAGFAEIVGERKTASLKGYSYVNPDIQEAMARFNVAYLDRVNVHTGVRYRDEPALIALLLTNENDITEHFGNLLLPEKGAAWHSRRFVDAAHSFAARHGLPVEGVLRTWEPGPSKLFLNDLEHAVNAGQIARLRELGFRIPLVSTSLWGSSPSSSLPALTAGDLIDAHAYGGRGELARDPAAQANIVHRLAAAQLLGRPVAVSEWNVERFPVADRHVVPLYVAASASHQGWDAVLQYAYAQIPLDGGGKPSNWHAFNDPALLSTLPAAALAYRRGDVREADTLYVFKPDRHQLFAQRISAETSPALRTAAERGRLAIALPVVPELPWLLPVPIPAGATIISDLRQPVAAPTSGEITSDSGELRRNWAQGFVVVDTPMTQAAMGELGGRELVLGDTMVALRTGSATVAVQSLDGRPIRSSRRLLVSLAGTSLPQSDTDPLFRTEPVLGTLSIRGRADLRDYTHGADRRTPSPRIVFDGRRHIIALDGSVRQLVLSTVPGPGRPGSEAGRPTRKSR